MANELQITVTVNYTKGSAKLNLGSSSYNVTCSGDGVIKNNISVGTTDETVALGDIATIGYVWIHNLDSTNYVLMGSDGTNYPIKIKPGESQLFRWNAAAIHLKANTAACKVEYALFED